VREDRDARERVAVGGVPHLVVVVPVRVDDVADGLVGEAPDLGDVLARGRRQVAGVDDQHGPLADHDRGVALRELVGRVGMADQVDARRHLLDGTRPRRGGRGVGGRRGHHRRQDRERAEVLQFLDPPGFRPDARIEQI
jgi:hypothetical protein